MSLSGCLLCRIRLTPSPRIQGALGTGFRDHPSRHQTRAKEASKKATQGLRVSGSKLDLPPALSAGPSQVPLRTGHENKRKDVCAGNRRHFDLGKRKLRKHSTSHGSAGTSATTTAVTPFAGLSLLGTGTLKSRTAVFPRARLHTATDGASAHGPRRSRSEGIRDHTIRPRQSDH